MYFWRMRILKRFLVATLLFTALGHLALIAQSDSQTLRSPYASLVGIAELDCLLAGEGSNAVWNESVGRPVPATDHISRSSGRHRNTLLREK